MKTLNLGWKTALLCTIGLVLAACGGGGGGSSPNKPRLRYLNASPDASPLSFSLDGNLRASGIGYLDLSPEFDEEDADSYDLTVKEDGDNPDFDAITASFGDDREYMVFGVGLENFGTETLKRLRLFVSEVSLTAPNGNKSRIYVLHAFNRATGFDTPNIDLRNPGDNPQYKVENISYGTIGALEIDASTQTFVARRSSSESVYVTKTETFVGGGIYIGIVSGVENAVGPTAPAITFIRIN